MPRDVVDRARRLRAAPAPARLQPHRRTRARAAWQPQRAAPVRRRPRARPLPARVPACARRRVPRRPRRVSTPTRSSSFPPTARRRPSSTRPSPPLWRAARPRRPRWEDELSDRLRRQPEVRAALDRMWPVLSGTELVHDLFGFEALIRSASGGVLTDGEQRLLLARARRRRRRRRVDRRRPPAGRRSRLDSRPAERGARRARVAGAVATASSRMARRTVEELGVGGFTNAADVLARYGSDAPTVESGRRRAAHLRSRARRRGAGPQRACSGACWPVAARRAR